MKFLLPILLFILSALVLAVSIRGVRGNPNELNIDTLKWKEQGPLELSPERGKFALTYSIVENNSSSFSLPLARFVAPDVGFYNGKYVSIFPPGISFITIPGYLIGRELGISQVGTYATIAVFALLNMLLIRLIVGKITKHSLAGSIAGLIFLFATPAFPYAVSLYQHHITTFLVLLSIFILIDRDSLVAVAAALFLYALSISIDSPNAIFLFPIGLYALTKLVKIESIAEKTHIRLRYLGLFSLLFAAIPFLFLFAFNNADHGDPYKLSGNLAMVRRIDENGNPIQNGSTQIIESNASLEEKAKTKNTSSLFKTRNLLNGVSVHLFSPDRGLLFFAPIVLFGFFGFVYFPKKHMHAQAVMIGVMASVFLLYSLWVDPWGGWAFADRYMIPMYALLCVFTGIALTHISRSYILSGLFIIATVYSISVNTLGALTTNTNPPQSEAQALEKISGRVEKYSYDRNWDYLNTAGSKSYIYQTLLSGKITAIQFYVAIVVINSVLVSALFASYAYSHSKRPFNYENT